MNQRMLQGAIRGVEVANVLAANYAEAERAGRPTAPYEQNAAVLLGNIGAYALAQEGLAERVKIPDADEALLRGSTFQALAQHERGESVTDLVIRSHEIYGAMQDMQLGAAVAEEKPMIDTEFQRTRPLRDTERFRELRRLGDTELIRRYQAEDTEAGAALLREHRGLIWTIVGEVMRTGANRWPGIERDDLFQVGALTFLEQAGRFNLNRQDRSFVDTYARETRRAVWAYYGRYKSAVNITPGTRRQIGRVTKATTTVDGPVTDQTLAKELDLPAGEATAKSYMRTTHVRSLRRYAELENLYSLEDAGRGNSDVEIIERAEMESLTRETPTTEVGDEAIETVLAEELWQAVSALPGREATVLRLQFRDGLTQKEIGERLGVSSTMIRTIRERALARLRHPEWSGRFSER